MIDRRCLDEMLNYITGYSIYAMDEEIRQGYITFAGGHRIGITGHATYEALRDTNEMKIKNIVDIGGLNIRIAHERKGCAESIIPFLINGKSIYNTFIFAAPGVGKTTYLRDIIRIFSSGENQMFDRKNTFLGEKICVIDERSEIAACINGVPQNDLGKRTDVLDACPKELGMQMALRSMSPDIIAVDELGKAQEFEMLERMRCSGVKVLGTLHAGEFDEIMRNPLIRNAFESGIVERLVELIRLENGERTFRVFDGQGNRIHPSEEVLIWEK